MTSRILATASVVAIAFGMGANAAELPSWNPQTICAEDSTPQHCGFLEGQARSQISQQWDFIPTRVRAKCLAVNEELGSESWRDFANCFAEASRGPSSGGGAEGTQVAQVAAADSGGSGSNAEMEALRAELDAAKVRVAELEASAADAEKIAEMEGELAKTKTALRSGEVRIEGLQARLLAAVDAQDGASGDGEAMQAALDKAEARARGAEFRSKALQATLMETIARSKSAETAGAESADRIGELEAELSKAQAASKLGAVRIEGLQTRLMAANDSAADSGGASARVAELEAQLEAMEDEARIASDTDGGRIMVLEAELAKAKVASDTDGGRIMVLEAQLAKAQAGGGAGDMGADSEESLARIASLESDLEKAKSAVRSGEVRIEGLQQRLMEAMDRGESQGGGSDQVAALEDSLSMANMRIDTLKSRLSARRDALADMKDEFGAAESNLANARTRITALQDAMIESRRAAAAAASSGSEAEAEAVAKSERLQRLLDNQRERAARVGAKVAEQRGRIGELENEVRSLRRVASTAGTASCQRRMTDAVGSGGIQFANNKADIRADAAQTIDRLIAIARDCEDTRITVKGHTDTSGERSYNLQLSQRRADAVVAYMERNGVSPSRVTAIGVGPDEPIADNNTRAGRTQNRRIEIVVE